MGRLIKAEFRKTLSLNTWWILIIPLVLASFWLSWAWGSITNDFVDYLGGAGTRIIAEQVGVSPDALPVGLLSIAHGVNITQLIPAIFGVFALAGEYHSKTITTTFLTAPNRVSALTAKMITYALWGALYGLLSFAMSAMATAITVDSDRMPSGGEWLAVLGATVLSYVLVTLFGIGFGAVLNRIVLAVILLIGYFLIVENVLVTALWSVTDVFGAILPNSTANGIVAGVAAEAFGITSLNLPGSVDHWDQYFIQLTAGAPGMVSWWAAALVFLVWTMVFFLGGWASNQRRDIT